MSERSQRLLEVRKRFAKRRTCEGLGPCLPEVRHRLRPHLASERMVGKLLDMLRLSIRIEPLDFLHDLAMESAPPILEQTAIGHLVGESMLEGVLEIWKEPSLVEELGSLKPGQAPAQRVLGELADCLQEPKGHVLADDRGGLQEPLILGRETIDTRGQDRLGRGGDLKNLRCLGQTIGGPLTRQDLRLHQSPHTLLKEERVPFRPLDQQALEGLEPRIAPEKGLQQLTGAFGGQGVDAELPVVRLSAPAVLILGPVVDEQQQTCRWQTFHKVVEQRLGLGIDPVEILEQDQERLYLALAQEQSLDAIERPLASLRRVEPFPLGIVGGQVEQPQQRRERGLEGSIERQELPRHFLEDLAGVIAVLDLKVGAEEIDDRQNRGRLAIRDRAALDHEPALGAMRAREVPVQAGLADARLAEDPDDLSATAPSEIERLGELSHLIRPSHELGKPACGVRLEAGAYRIRADELVNLDAIA